MFGSTHAAGEIKQTPSIPEHSRVQQHELGNVLADNIKITTSDPFLLLSELPPELITVSSKSKLVWVKFATVLDSSAYWYVTPNGICPQ